MPIIEGKSYPRLENGEVIYAPASSGQGKQPAADAPEAPKPPPARDIKGRTAKKKATSKKTED